jgi:uncharacterized protein YegP (UPF0339 family)
MAARKPRIVYSWVTMRPSKASGRPVKVECIWSLLGANGEHMCSSFPETYRDKTDARRAVYAVAAALSGEDDPAAVGVYAREVGPGKKPE